MTKIQKIVSATMMTMMLALGLLVVPAPAQAALIDTAYATSSDVLSTGELGLDYATYTGLGTTDVRITIAKVIRVAMGLLGIVAVVIVLIGGFTWMTAGGNDEKIGEAKKWIFAGVIGMAIILSSYALANFVIDNLVKATTDSAANRGSI